MKKILTLLAIAAAMLACESDQRIDAPCPTDRIEILAVGDDSRTTLAENGLGTVWAPAEKIGVFGAATANAVFVSNNTEAAPSATFSGEVAAGDAPQYAYYPYSAASTALTDVAFSLPAEQTQSGSSPDIAAADFKIGTVTAQSDGTYKAAFRQMMSLIKFSIDASGTDLAGRHLESVSMTSVDALLAGDFRVDILTEEFAAEAEVDAVTVSLLDRPVLTSAVDAWAIVNPSLKAGDLIEVAVTAMADNGDLSIWSFPLTLAQTMQRGTAYTVPVTLSAIDGVTVELIPALTLPEDTDDLPAEGATLTLGVSPLFDVCTVGSDSEWCTVEDNGDGTYTIYVQPNTGAARTATVTVSASSTESDAAVNRSFTVSQAAASEYDPSTETANCYIVAAAGTYSFDATVMGNGVASLCAGSQMATEIDPVSAALLWQDTEGFVTAVELENGRINYTVGGNSGNAVIAAYDADGAIVWSWHIWGAGKTLADVAMGGRKYLEYNLGARSAEDVGMLYQGGRKDPFPLDQTVFEANIVIDTTAYRVKPAGSQYYTYTIRSEKGTYAYSYAYPNHYLISNSDNKGVSSGTNYHGLSDWYFYTNLNADLESRWGDAIGTKTVNDPCPAGYKIPSESDALRLTADDIAHLPIVTSQHMRSNLGKISTINGAAYLWTTKYMGGSYYTVKYTATSISPDADEGTTSITNSMGAASGVSVRCVKME